MLFYTGVFLRFIMEHENKKTRREFLGDVLWTGSAAAMSGFVCLGMSEKARGADRDTRFDLISMTKIDPEMILYEEMGNPVKTGLKRISFYFCRSPGPTECGGR